MLKGKDLAKLKGILRNVMLTEKLKKIVLIVGLAGMGLILMSNFITESKPKESAKKNSHIEYTTEEYRVSIENHLKDIVSEIKGAGKSKILVTVETGAETIYATEKKKNVESSEDTSSGDTVKKKSTDDSEMRYITVRDSNGAEKALSIMQVQPKIKGVVIVCEGGDDSVVQEKVVNAITTALNITSKRVFVTK